MKNDKSRMADVSDQDLSNYSPEMHRVFLVERMLNISATVKANRDLLVRVLAQLEGRDPEDVEREADALREDRFREVQKRFVEIMSEDSWKEL